MHKNSLSTFLLFVGVAIIFLIGGYAAGSGQFGGQGASFYTAQKATNQIAKPVNTGTTGPTGGDAAPASKVVKDEYGNCISFDYAGTDAQGRALWHMTGYVDCPFVKANQGTVKDIPKSGTTTTSAKAQ